MNQSRDFCCLARGRDEFETCVEFQLVTPDLQTQRTLAFSRHQRLAVDTNTSQPFMKGGGGWDSFMFPRGRGKLMGSFGACRQSWMAWATLRCGQETRFTGHLSRKPSVTSHYTPKLVRLTLCSHKPLCSVLHLGYPPTRL